LRARGVETRRMAGWTHMGPIERADEAAAFLAAHARL